LLDIGAVYTSRTGFLKMIYISPDVQGSFAATWRIGGGEQCCPVHPHTLAAGSACVCDPGFTRPMVEGQVVVASARRLSSTAQVVVDDALPCEACAPGSFKDTPGDGACSICPEDHFCPGGSVEPTACPANSSAAPGTDLADDCRGKAYVAS
jgi:hypothetical protein